MEKETTVEECMEAELETMQVMVSLDHYEELVRKAAALDLLTADIRLRIDQGETYGVVSDSLVMAVTGMSKYKAMKRAETGNE